MAFTEEGAWRRGKGLGLEALARLVCWARPSEVAEMGTMSGAVQQLRRERDRAQKEVQRIDAALAALGSVSSNSVSRTLSASGRRKISQAQKAGWAMQRTAKPKRTSSAAGRKRIAAAQRARWAKVKRAG